MGRFVFLLALCGFLLSCKKEKAAENTPYADDYRFYTRAKINGLPLDLYAGEDGYGLETDYAIEDDIVVMSGTLGRPQRPLKNALVLKIRSAEKVNSSGTFDAEKSLRPGLYALRDRSGTAIVPGEYELDFFGDTTLHPMNYHWQFADSSYSYLKNPGPKVVKLADHSDPYAVTLTTDYSGCESRITHQINLEAECDATFTIRNVSTYSCKVEVLGRVGNIVKVDWMLDSEPVVPDFSGHISVPYLGGSHTLTAIIEFESGCKKVVTRKFDGSAPQPCFTDFWYTKKQVTTYDENQLGTIEVEYYDEDGKMYSTFYSDVEGQFKIISLTPYRTNGAGQKTTRFFFEAHAILKNTDGSSVDLSECFGSFAVAHP